MAHLQGSKFWWNMMVPAALTPDDSCILMIVPAALIPDDSCILWCFRDMLLANPAVQT